MNARAEVLLVGLGGIGFRHLQGLGSIKDRVRLWAVDQDPAACDRASEEWRRIGGEAGGVSTSLDEMTQAADLCILATPARGRLELIRRVLPRVAGGSLVIEKVAFLSMPEMDDARAFLDRQGKKTFVNCARRLWPLYQDLRRRLGQAPIDIEVRGRALALASNGVHFLDLLQFLSGERDVLLEDWKGSGVIPAKRPSYYEAYGALRARTPNGSTIAISVTPDDPAAHAVTIKTSTGTLEINEMTGDVTGDERWSCGRAPYQSELTGAMAASLLDRGHCDLPSLADSSIVHSVLLEALGREFEQAGIDCSAGAPIT